MTNPSASTRAAAPSGVIDGTERLALTKLDGTTKKRIVFAIAKELGIPMRYADIGGKMNAMIEFSPDAYVRGLFD